MNFFPVRLRKSARLILFSSLMFSEFVAAQTCLTAADMDEPARNAVVSAAKKYFDMAARGDAASLKQNAIPSLASDFGAIETAIKDNQANLSGAQANARPPVLLKAEGKAPLPKAEFLCGVFGAQGQTRDSAEFVIPNLPPGNYGVVVLDLPTSDLPSAGKTYKLTQLFPLAVGKDLDLVVKYQSADVSNTAQTFQDNAAVMKGLVTKYPELRDAFAGIVARAVEPSGRDYGSLLAMKDIK